MREQTLKKNDRSKNLTPFMIYYCQATQVWIHALKLVEGKQSMIWSLGQFIHWRSHVIILVKGGSFKLCRSCQLSHAILLKKENLSKLESTVLALFEPHSWIEPHPLRNHAKMQFLCVFYVTIWGQKPILKNISLGFKERRHGNWLYFLVQI